MKSGYEVPLFKALKFNWYGRLALFLRNTERLTTFSIYCINSMHPATNSLPDNIENAYELVGQKTEQGSSAEAKYFAELISNAGKNLRVLDLGCGNGALAVELAKRGHYVLATDISTSNLRKTQLSAQIAHVSVEVAKYDLDGNCRNIKGYSKFDVVFLMDVIEHLKNPLKALSNIHQLLSVTGLFFINTPNSITPGKIYYYLRKNRAIKQDFFNPACLWDFHFQTYDYLSLLKTLNFVGFDIQEQVPGFVLIPIPFVNKNLRSRFLASFFPGFSENLLLKCVKHDPIDFAKQVQYWGSLSQAGKGD